MCKQLTWSDHSFVEFMRNQCGDCDSYGRNIIDRLIAIVDKLTVPDDLPRESTGDYVVFYDEDGQPSMWAKRGSDEAKRIARPHDSPF